MALNVIILEKIRFYQFGERTKAVFRVERCPHNSEKLEGICKYAGSE